MMNKIYKNHGVLKLFIAALCIIIPISAFSQSIPEIDEKIDSLQALLFKNTEDKERLRIWRLILKQRKIKKEIIEYRDRLIFPDLDSIRDQQSTTIKYLWNLSKERKVSISQRDSIYEILFTHKEGLDTLVNNIMFEKYNYDSDEDLMHRPVLLFLHRHRALYLFDYIEEKACEENYTKNLQYLLFTTFDMELDKKIYIQLIASYLKMPCLNAEQKKIINDHLDYAKELYRNQY